MLCETCRIMFPFYLKYCRQCGRKLSESERPPAVTLTAELASKPQMEDAVTPVSAYVTAPLTMRIGTPGRNMADLLRQVLNSYPSLKTTRLSGQAGGAPPLREFSMDEFVAVERTAGLTIDDIKNMFCSEPAGESSTLELPLMTIADTVPLELQSEPEKVREKRVAPTAALEESVCELRQTRPLARARLHLRPTGPGLALEGEARLFRNRLLDVARLVLSRVFNYLIEKL
jgi:hypothetical protein